MAVLSLLGTTGFTRLRNRVKARLLRERFPVDRTLGYPVHRGYYSENDWSGALRSLSTTFQPEVIVFQSWDKARLALVCELFNPRRIFVWAHWIPRDPIAYGIDTDVCARFARQADVHWLANSPYTHRVLRTAIDVDAPIIRPIFGCSRYRSVRRRTPRSALFASLNRHKGIDTVFSLADARPDLSFVVGDTWVADRQQRKDAECALADRRNVSLRTPRASIADLYADTRVLLMPSRGPETWGRMVTEAQSAGIPVLASREGNLVDTVGPGGVCLSGDAPIEEWVETFSRMMDDHHHYCDLSMRALEWSRREEVDEESVALQLESALRAVI